MDHLPVMQERDGFEDLSRCRRRVTFGEYEVLVSCSGRRVRRPAQQVAARR